MFKMYDAPDQDPLPNICDFCGFPLASGKYHEGCALEVAKLKLKGAKPMEKETLEALQGSIKKWENIRFEGGEDRGGINCPLCLLFLFCDLCPVMIKTGRPQCEDTPYITWVNHHDNKHDHQGYNKSKICLCPTCKKIATQEIKFLKSLFME